MQRFIVALSLAFGSCAPAHAQVGALYDTVAVLTYEDGRVHRLRNNAAPIPLDDCMASRPGNMLSLIPYMHTRPDLVDGLASVDVVCIVAGEGV